jgi:pilus assembly protein Flp/PilA
VKVSCKATDELFGLHYFRASAQNPAGKEEITMLYLPKEKGQGLVEYALILVLVAVVVIVILALLGPAIGNVFSGIVRQI